MSIFPRGQHSARSQASLLRGPRMGLGPTNGLDTCQAIASILPGTWRWQGWRWRGGSWRWWRGWGQASLLLAPSMTLGPRRRECQWRWWRGRGQTSPLLTPRMVLDANHGLGTCKFHFMTTRPKQSKRMRRKRYRNLPCGYNLESGHHSTTGSLGVACLDSQLSP